MDMNGPVAMAGSSFQLFECHGYQRSENGGEHDNGEQTDGYRVGNCGRTAEPYKIVYIHQQGYDGCIDCRHYGFLGDLLECVFGGSKELLASPCTIIAEDWVPTFPPVPPIRRDVQRHFRDVRRR